MCSRRYTCSICNSPPCAHGNYSLCLIHCWPQLKCVRCHRLVSELIHKLIFYYFHSRRRRRNRMGNAEEVVDDHDQELLKIIDDELAQINQQSNMYDIVSENWLSMEKVFLETAFLNRYTNAEEWRMALNVLHNYFNLNENSLKLLTLEKFKKETNELLVDFLKEKLDELMYLFAPDEKIVICIECVEEEISNRITEMSEKKPENHAVRLVKEYSVGPEWLIDDLMGHVLSFLVFPRDFPSISLTCKRFYYFLHYSTNFSWLSNLTMPNRGEIAILRLAPYDKMHTFMEKIFKTYHGFRSLSSISKIYNLFHECSDRVTNTMFIHHLMKSENKFKCNLDTISINTFGFFGLGFVSYYWLLKRTKEIPLKYLTIESDAYTKSFGMLMILKNAHLIFDPSNSEVNVRAYSSSNFIELKSLDFLNNSLDLTETGLQTMVINFQTTLPGVENQYVGYVSHYQLFNIDSDSEKIIPLLRDDLIINMVWVHVYQSNIISLLRMMEDRGFDIKVIVLDATCFNSCSQNEREELLTLKTRVEVGKSHAVHYPPTERWDLKSVIQ
ncbi:predicted protein [Naegleria gruberi]|uniref:Predicted protein n=1 Tax=Naegleria gruberi TaxID=5762 RepID=D2VI24_NAEGR|nr:uncharacterized protein NAEGRDRAFT_68535 [Naegleria gruberi]EFC43516.1 predicted protein [Naegleria gruberi]|eukprot:XP_002676260.1 predicted protein [Naegleria gruberi strain NEG-M]